MPASYVHSALAQHAARLADNALESPEGVAIFYADTACGSHAAAKVAAKRFQTAFNTMRTRDRNRIQRARGESTKDILTDVYSEYDSLACLCNPKEDGFEIQLIRTHLIDNGIVVRDIASGEEIWEFSAIGRTSNFLAGLMTEEAFLAEKMRRKKKNIYTDEQIQWFLDNDPGAIQIIKDMHGIDIRRPSAPAGPTEDEKAAAILAEMMESIESLSDRTPQKTA